MRLNREAVSSRIRIIKEKIGLSISQMAEIVGTSKTNLNAYLRGVSLPPEKIAQNISKLGGYKENWVFYGDNFDYINELLIELEFEEMIKDRPYVVDEINEEYEMLLTNKEYEGLNKEDLLYAIVMNKYNVYFDLYIINVIQPIVNKLDYELNKIDEKDKYINRYISRINNLVKKETPIIKYGDKDGIYKIAKNQYDIMISSCEVYDEKNNKFGDIVNLFINKLSSENEVRNFLRTISNYENVKFDSEDIKTKQLVEKLHNLYPQIVKLSNQSSE
ncbi:helix-turn-helix transcriptional regulator [uncultured Psychrobacillus sp.]|uniref:helix-turn-helix domain-containing protein n=1 Tax=uncultured Psychrobacillus sp. TaxID=1551585 RepID=UPI00262E9521|nr:helix-turn-helix transcriptional regulator [uncultured Psychrobacillus sp.]